MVHHFKIRYARETSVFFNTLHVLEDNSALALEHARDVALQLQPAGPCTVVTIYDAEKQVALDRWYQGVWDSERDIEEQDNA